MRLKQWFEDFRSDAIFGLRQLRGAPAFTIIAALTLALGIGANGAIFALVDAALLRPLQLGAPDRLVEVWERDPSSARTPTAPANVADWRERARAFEAFGGYVGGVGAMVMGGVGNSAESVARQWVTSGFFDVLGVPAIAGRTFKPSDDDPGGQARAVVLNEAFWRARFNADPGVIGRKIRFDGQPYTVVGVVPGWFQSFGRTSIWALVSPPRIPQMRTAYFVQTIGRMKPGVSIEAATEELSRIAGQLARELPQTNAGRGVIVEPIRVALVGSEVRLTAMLFLGVVGLVLLICCANVANLLLARATVRSRELAIRAALGAGRRRVLRQLLTESVILSAIGGVLGAGVGALILQVAPSVMPEGLLPSAVTLEFDTRVALFCALAAIAVGLVFGLAPAWQATGVTSSSAMASDGRGTTGRGGWLRTLLVVAEVATAVVLLVGAGLLLRTLLALEQVDRGYRADRVLSMMVDPLASEYREPGSLQRFFDNVEREVRKDPAVRSVAWASTLPLGTSEVGDLPFEIVGDPPVDARSRPTADYQIVSPAYFQTVDLPIVAGRAFTDRDGPGSVRVCIVNEAFVRRFLRGRHPIGVRVLFQAGSENAQIRQIVGVARQVKARPDETEDLIQTYVPIGQDAIDDIFLLARPVTGPAEALAPSVRAAIGRVDTAQLVNVADVMTLDDVARLATSRHRFRAVAVVTFAGLALVLAMVGVFGVMAYSIQQRVREFGVRMALGATRADMLRLVLGSAAGVVAAGAAVGLLVASLATSVLNTVLFGVQPLDPQTFAVVIVVLGLTAAASTAIPAWRATRVDPAAIMKSD
ncbi:MAG TPA: ABC transporter permease [Vicinamibacterales bacterium]|jgi:putative ABC transport system permease protein|nr:ABC transporter permease [Vicinamibacterales bacterium]